MVKAPANGPATTLRPLELDPARTRRAERPPYGIVDIGSNSVRLVVYDQLGRAPLPRFNEKSLCRLGEGLAETGAIHPEGFRRTVDALRRFRAIADAMGVVKLDVTGDRGDPPRVKRAGARRGDPRRVRAQGAHPQRRRRGALLDARRHLRLLPPHRRGRRHGRRQSRGGRGARRPGRRRLGQPAARRVAGRGDARRGRANAKRAHRRDPARKPAAGARPAGVLSRSAAAGAPSPRRIWRRPTRRSGSRTAIRIDAAEAREFAKSLLRLSPAKLAATPGVADAARPHPARRRAGARPRAETPRAGARRLLGARVCARGCSIRSSSEPSNISIRWSRARSSSACRRRACRNSRPRWCAGPPICFPAKRRRKSGCGSRSARSPTSPGAIAPELRAEESFRRVLQFPFIGVDHAERAFLAAAIRARYAGRPDAPWLEPAISLLIAERGGARRFSAARCCSPTASPAACRRCSRARGCSIEADSVALEVAAAARAPDSEVVGDRLKLLAAAIGVRRSEIVALDDEGRARR